MVQGEFGEALFSLSLGACSERTRAAYELLGALPTDVGTVDLERLLTEMGQLAGPEIAHQARELLREVSP